MAQTLSQQPLLLKSLRPSHFRKSESCIISITLDEVPGDVQNRARQERARHQIKIPAGVERVKGLILVFAGEDGTPPTYPPHGHRKFARRPSSIAGPRNPLLERSVKRQAARVDCQIPVSIRFSSKTNLATSYSQPITIEIEDKRGRQPSTGGLFTSVAGAGHFGGKAFFGLYIFLGIYQPITVYF